MMGRSVLTLSWAGIFLLGGLVSSGSAQQVIYLVRHAEKLDETADTALSPAGKKRAEALRDALKDAGITAIFTSTFRRTKDTGQPLADALGIMPQRDDISDPAAMVAKLRDQHGEGKVLIVGHSDTVPALIKALGCTPVPAIGPDDFDNLFVVLPGKVTRPQLVRLHYRR
jgi:broad specificity phosphatase PhoE